jgi:hypothetical protein
MSHACPAPGCKRDGLDDKYLMCAADWRRVPAPLRKAVWAAYDNGAGVGSPALRAAQLAAIRALLAGGR